MTGSMKSFHLGTAMVFSRFGGCTRVGGSKIRPLKHRLVGDAMLPEQGGSVFPARGCCDLVLRNIVGLAGELQGLRDDAAVRGRTRNKSFARATKTMQRRPSWPQLAASIEAPSRVRGTPKPQDTEDQPH